MRPSAALQRDWRGADRASAKPRARPGKCQGGFSNARPNGGPYRPLDVQTDPILIRELKIRSQGMDRPRISFRGDQRPHGPKICTPKNEGMFGPEKHHPPDDTSGTHVTVLRFLRPAPSIGKGIRTGCVRVVGSALGRRNAHKTRPGKGALLSQSPSIQLHAWCQSRSVQKPSGLRQGRSSQQAGLDASCLTSPFFSPTRCLPCMPSYLF
jgi:hypothetical protein